MKNREEYCAGAVRIMAVPAADTNTKDKKRGESNAQRGKQKDHRDQ